MSRFASGDPVNLADPFGLKDCKNIPVTVTDDSGSTSTTVRVCDSKDRDGEEGWEKGSSLDNAITDLLKEKPGQGFAPGFGTVYVNDVGNEEVLVHEISHELLARRIPVLYQHVGLAEIFSRLWTNPYAWNPKLPYARQRQEARAAVDGACYAADALACSRTPYRYTFPKEVVPQFWTARRAPSCRFRFARVGDAGIAKRRVEAIVLHPDLPSTCALPIRPASAKSALVGGCLVV